MNQSDGLVLTYWGFTYRKLGETVTANSFYEKAISIDPNNFLARSYMGQGLVSEGRIADAREQLEEIRTRGGKGTWAEKSLNSSIETGTGYSY